VIILIAVIDHYRQITVFKYCCSSLGLLFFLPWNKNDDDNDDDKDDDDTTTNTNHSHH